MTLSFHPEAKEEFNEAIENVVHYPTVWPIMEEDLRRCLLKRFLYGIIYSIEQDEIFILAVMHLH